MSPFKLDFLDHVAIRVSDMEASAKWYAKALGLKRFQPEEWKPFPIMMIAGATGVALFPLNEDDQKKESTVRNLTSDHFAFRVSEESFELAQERFQSLGINFIVKDHTYYHSIYINDPDGHTVELTKKIKE